LNRGHHLYSAGWPSRWALAHILVLCYGLFVYVCFCCVRLSFFSTMPRGWLGRMSPKWHILCWVECKTLTQSINQSINLYKCMWIMLVYLAYRQPVLLSLPVAACRLMSLWHHSNHRHGHVLNVFFTYLLNRSEFLPSLKCLGLALLLVLGLVGVGILYQNERHNG